MKRSFLCVLLACLLLPVPVKAADIRIAVVAPQSGNLEILGRQVMDGARLAADGKAEIVAIDETCAENPGIDIGRRIAEAKVSAAIGFLCSDSLEGALPQLARAGIPAITVSVRASILMEDSLAKGWPLFRLAPAPTAERDAIIDAIFRNWKDKPFALLDDGTITSRDMAETVRDALELKGMKATLIDNFRPAQEVQTLLVRRLAKAGVTHVFAAADRADMAVMARDAKQAKLDLVFLGGDALNATDQGVALQKGVLAVTMPDLSTLSAAKPVVEALAKAGRSAEGYVLPAYAAIEIVLQAREIADGSGATMAQALVETPFQTVIDEIRFTKAHERASNPFRLLQWDGQAFQAPAPTQ